MALSLGQTGTADSVDADYLTQEQDGAPVRIHMHQDAVDGIARDAMEGFKSLPVRGLEIGGLLLGHVEPGDRPAVWIDRYQRIECQHRFGPQFVLDEEDRRALERSAAAISQSGELNVVGFYRSHTRPGFQLEESDFELVRQYFNDPSDLILLIRPEKMRDISARFFARGDGGMLPTGPVFPFRGRTISSLDEADDDVIEPDTGRTSPPERRRLVPDFAGPDEPKAPLGNFQAGEVDSRMNRTDMSAPGDEEPRPEHSSFLRKWWPMLAAMILVGGALAFLLAPRAGRHDTATSQVPAETASPIRPLGLYVDPSGDSWRVSWNSAATALHDAKAVQLFVRDGDDQNRIDLTARDLQSGTYQYQPKGQDVTFRLEVTGADGHISAESFRFVKSPPTPVAVAPTASKPAPPIQQHLKPIHRVAPVVPSSIRPRIQGSVTVNVRVRVDSRGRVTSAVPVAKMRPGLESYLADRALIAARQWRFEAGPGGVEIIHFAFER